MSENIDTINKSIIIINPIDATLTSTISENNMKITNTSDTNRPLESVMNSNGGTTGYLSIVRPNLLPTTIDPFSWYFKISDDANKSFLELGGAFEDPLDDPAYFNNRIKHNEILMVSDKVGNGGLLRLVYNPLSGGSGLYHSDTGSDGFTIEETQGNLDIKTIGGYDITLQSSNQINLNSSDDVNINCGVNINMNAGGNILASTTDTGSAIFNTKNGTFIAGDADGSYNKTGLTINDATQDIFIINTNGRITNGDITGIGTGAMTRFDISNRLMSMKCGQQASVDSVNDTIGTRIEEYCNFVNTDVDVQMKEVGNYFNNLTTNNDGWYCYIMNYSGGDINITSNDGKQFISRTPGGIQPIGILGKYTTARLTLVYLHSLGDYFWSFMSGV